MGVWIEISWTYENWIFSDASLPAWECGLKFYPVRKNVHCGDVTPCVGVWIEIIDTKVTFLL